MHINELFDITGKVALVTGGSRGLGKEIARGLGEAGAKVVISARREEWLRPTAEELRAAGIDCLDLLGDVAKPVDAQRLVAETLAKYGQLDILVNNAGQTWGQNAEDVPPERWHQIIDANLTSTFLVSQSVAKHFMERGEGGVIVNIASVAGLVGGNPGVVRTVAYSASKGGIIAMTRELASEWGPHHIRVNSVAPGFFPSRMTAATLKEFGDRLVEKTPLKRLGGDDDLKGVVLFLVSPAARHVTGVTIAVDGGSSITGS